jgi:hypothetical protein
MATGRARPNPTVLFRFFGRSPSPSRSQPIERSISGWQPSGTHGYDDLRRDAIELEILGVQVPLASLADIIRSKEAADRPKDRLTLPVLRRILEEGGS